MKHNQQRESDFEQMVERQRGAIYAVCYMYAKDSDQVSDLFQEALLRLWAGFDNFEGRSSERTWVYRVTLNSCIDQTRRLHHCPDTMPLTLDNDFFADEERNPAAKSLHRRISQLPPFDRALILLWLEDLPYSEIADIIGISVDNVGVRLNRIREKLKTIKD